MVILVKLIVAKNYLKYAAMNVVLSFLAMIINAKTFVEYHAKIIKNVIKFVKNHYSAVIIVRNLAIIIT